MAKRTCDSLLKADRYVCAIDLRIAITDKQHVRGYSGVIRQLGGIDDLQKTDK